MVAVNETNTEPAIGLPGLPREAYESRMFSPSCCESLLPQQRVRPFTKTAHAWSNMESWTAGSPPGKEMKLNAAIAAGVETFVLESFPTTLARFEPKQMIPPFENKPEGKNLCI